MYGWQARPCTNLHGLYRWFGVVPQGCEVLFPSFFVVFFCALCWRSFEDELLRFLVGVTCMRILCLFAWWLCPQISLGSDSIWWFFELGEFLT
jgi:Na+-driven multidrug efflux pump